MTGKKTRSTKSSSQASAGKETTAVSNPEPTEAQSQTQPDSDSLQPKPSSKQDTEIAVSTEVSQGATVSASATPTKTSKPRAPRKGMLAQVFGVRHLSPTAALHVREWLDTTQPSAVAIEAPSDFQSLIPWLVHPDTKPPVALVAFTQEGTVTSATWPLAEYSPEWVALRWAHEHGVAVHFIDLPSSVFLSLANKEESQGFTGATAVLDPCALLAEIDGESHYESWWERTFEQVSTTDDYRNAMVELGQWLRTLTDPSALQSPSPLALREAYMRRAVRAIISSGISHEKIAVVCGALHTQSLSAELDPMSDKDARALSRAEVSLSVVPYTFSGMVSSGSYGAGRTSPGYYQLLWQNRENVHARYIALVAGQLRKMGFFCSSAETIEALRLAQTLAAMRESSCVTLRELQDAVSASFANAAQEAIRTACANVEVGDVAGTVSQGGPKTSLQEDFYRQVKALKLDDYLKDNWQRVRGHGGEWLDLRPNRAVKSEESAMRDRNRSVFFHRLSVLGVPFVKNVTSPEDKKRGSYKEAWEAKWTADGEMCLYQSSPLGDTIERAADAYLVRRTHHAKDVAETAKITEQAVRCELSLAITLATKRIALQLSHDEDFLSVTEALRALAEITQYDRDVRRVDVTAVKPLVHQLFVRAVLLAPKAAKCDPTVSKTVCDALSIVHRVASFGGWTRLVPIERWIGAIEQIADDSSSSPYVAGYATVLLLDTLTETDDVLASRVTRVLTDSDPRVAAEFLEGLLARNRMALLMRTKLWQAIVLFIQQLEPTAFTRVLVPLRRAFADFSLVELRSMVRLLGSVWAKFDAPQQESRSEKIVVSEKERQELERALQGIEALA